MSPHARCRSPVATIASIVALATCLGAGPSAAQQAASRFDFEGAQAGLIPPGFSPGLTGKGLRPSWQAVEDPTAPAGPRVVAETSGDRTDYRFPLLVLDGVETKDVQVTVAFKPLSGDVDRAAGIAVRLKDADNYYVVRANALEGNVRLYKIVGGKRSQFAGKDAEVTSGQWQTLGLGVQGDRFEVRLNGEALFEARDRTFEDAGQVGLWTKADSVTYSMTSTSKHCRDESGRSWPREIPIEPRQRNNMIILAPYNTPIVHNYIR
jgi:hypothetical protein